MAEGMNLHSDLQISFWSTHNRSLNPSINFNTIFKKLIKRNKTGILHGYYATGCMLTYIPNHILQLCFPLYLHDGVPGLTFN